MTVRDPFEASSRAYLKPGEDRTVRKADGSYWDAEGEWTESSMFVRRRLADGDLVVAQPPTADASAAPRSKAAAAGKQEG